MFASVDIEYPLRSILNVDLGGCLDARSAYMAGSRVDGLAHTEELLYLCAQIEAKCAIYTMSNQNPMIKMRKNSLLLYALALSTWSLVANPHHTDSIRTLDAVEVSAKRFVAPSAVSKIPAPARQIPVSVTQLEAGKMREMHFTDLSAATRDIPGVNSFRDYGAFHMFFVRGFYESIVMHDGIRDDRHALWQSAPITGMSSVERIEFIKGAASMTVGHSALGGAINIVHKQPTAQSHYNARISAGSWGTIHAQGGASGAITDRLTFRADAELLRSRGWRDNYRNVANARLALDWVINSNHKLSFILKGNRDSYGGDYGQPHLKWDLYRKSDNSLTFGRGSLPINVPRSLSYSDPADDLSHRAWAAAIRYEGYLGNGWKLHNSLSTSYDDIDYYSTDVIGYLTGSDAPASAPYYYRDGDKQVPVSIDQIKRYGFAFAYNTLAVQDQLELTGKKQWGSTTHALLFGLGYTYMRLPRYDGATYSGPNYNSDGEGGITSSTAPERNQGYLNWTFGRRQLFTDQVYALYAQDYLTWGKLNALASLRLDYFSRNYEVNKIAGIGHILSTSYDHTVRNLALTYRFGLVYNFSKAFNVYASTSNFYKPQRVVLSSEVIYLHANGTEMTPSDLKKLPPVKGEQYEVGAHLDLGNTLSVNIAAYHISMSNVMKSNIGSLNGKRIGGLVGRSTSRGVEVDVAYSPIKALDLTLGYAYTDARVREFSSTVYTKDVAAGNYVRRVPRHKLVAWAFGNLALGHDQRLRLGLGLEQNGQSFTDERNLYKLPSYTVLHALAVYRTGAWTLQLNVNNLLDATYYRSAINSVQFIPAEERNLTLTVGFDL